MEGRGVGPTEHGRGVFRGGGGKVLMKNLCIHHNWGADMLRLGQQNLRMKEPQQDSRKKMDLQRRCQSGPVNQ